MCYSSVLYPVFSSTERLNGWFQAPRALHQPLRIAAPPFAQVLQYSGTHGIGKVLRNKEEPHVSVGYFLLRNRRWALVGELGESMEGLTNE